MKKLTLLLSAIVCVAVMSSCCGGKNQKDEATTPEQTTECAKKCDNAKPACNLTEEQKAECEAFKAKWNDFDNLTVDEQKELIAKKKECIDKRREEAKAKMAECEAKWANFETLTIAEQKAFLDENSCCKKAKDCKKEGDTKCKAKCTKESTECTKGEAKK